MKKQTKKLAGPRFHGEGKLRYSIAVPNELPRPLDIRISDPFKKNECWQIQVGEYSITIEDGPLEVLSCLALLLIPLVEEDSSELDRYTFYHDAEFEAAGNAEERSCDAMQLKAARELIQQSKQRKGGK
ncbi:MAG: hypothetical protein K8T91_21370 [Planctomycetes bacterium]|nr:hypothetical protein [Planctomycetota bacterium]